MDVVFVAAAISFCVSLTSASSKKLFPLFSTFAPSPRNENRRI